MFKVQTVTDARGEVWIDDPPVTRVLFRSARLGWLWLLARLFVGFEFLEAGFHKSIDPTWMDGSGEAILGFWWQSVTIPEPPARPPITFDWYRGFLQLLIDSHSAPWFSQLIVYSELAVGLGLILGAFVGVLAAGALIMNVAFMLAGVNATNPVLIVLDFLLIMAWKNAGYVGLDRYLLGLLGTPWKQIPYAEAWQPARARPVGRSPGPLATSQLDSPRPSGPCPYMSAITSGPTTRS